MPNRPIGITFMPSEENAAEGSRRNALEGSGGSDLAQAFKVLSLRLPRVLGARAITSRRLLEAPGAAGIPGAFSPETAVFEALLRSLTGAPQSNSLGSVYGRPAGAEGGAGGGGGGGPQPGPGTRVEVIEPSATEGEDFRVPQPDRLFDLRHGALAGERPFSRRRA